MSLKSILAVVASEGEDAAVIDAAAKVASRFDAKVRVLPAFADPAADFVYYGAALQTTMAANVIAESEKVEQERIETLARDIAVRNGVAITVEKRALQPVVALAPEAVLSDIVVFGAGAAKSPTLGPIFAETLLSTRAPVLVVKGAPPAGGAVAVAWDGSAQAARAVRAALPFLQAASGVLILRNIDDESAEAEAGSPERLRTYLAAHGVEQIAVRSLHGARVAPSLIDAAHDDKCDLLVAGAYGRPRLFEIILGGTTRSLTHAPEGPSLLLAH